ncbi:Fur family transcriptional regulator [Shewanella sp. 1_MG-2023]|uniref:Transcriptional repressor n=1 Tax=Shewanella electrodiphila TaxID=934143 RepID=A0ABT0KNH7_9GAMM|nr:MULTISPECIES: Fur family transcriptional regulator [Shewanella]MCC4832511.1 transcriptional repressor [Shewanella sp. 10N.7]MCL1045405.1 transcriptional repressor [Shewanella electrodiphila]MDO6611367.1 Fur family transcriptional regulator [Shewanella sp. 7_MG-2023]MDO6771222.1 Fur family transcriptional regulator [Shewanella sp. 2_MG-2023]MDO6795463.1 Fur family transcriptional regulator [Shewanella sp. 1_MG-2023]
MPTHKNVAIFTKAEQICRDNGVKLTEKRKNVLGVLLNSSKPLSAYEIVDIYRTTHQEALAPMSVYRMLDILSQLPLVHKLSSENKYLACSHITCEHAHEVPQFLICKTCGKVAEKGIQTSVIEALKDSIKQADFQLINSQIEIQCLCKDCAASN